MKFFKKIKNKKEKGFSLVEALLAVTILMMSVAAPLKLAGEGVNSTMIAEQQIIAFYLTQDAMEYVRGIKTGNRLVNRDILFGLDSCDITQNPSGCCVDTRDASIKNYNSCSNGLLTFHESIGVYDHNSVGGKPSIYKRRVKIVPRRSNPITAKTVEAVIEVTTSWTGPRGSAEEYVLKSNILDW